MNDISSTYQVYPDKYKGNVGDEGVGAVNVDDINYFTHLMAYPESSSSTSYQVEAREAIDLKTNYGLGEEGGRNNMGDGILNGLDRLRQVSKEETDKIATLLKVEDMSAQQMLQVQHHMNIWTVKQEIMSKCVGDIDRCVDTFLKAQ